MSNKELPFTWEYFFNRTKYNRMNGDEQDRYIESLKKKAERANAKLREKVNP